MKARRITAMLLAACVVLAAGCGKNATSNKYVEVSKYKGVEVEKAVAEEVKDEDVTSYIDSVRAEHRVEVKDRELIETDVAEFDYRGTLDGKEFDKGTLTLGNGESYVPGFVEGIYGHKIGETFDFPVTFPEGYGGEEKPELSGAKVTFTVTIKSIKGLPELNDELVKKVSEESKTVEEYKNEVKKILEEKRVETAEETLKEAVWKEVLKNVKVKEYPEDRVKKLTDDAKKQMKDTVKAYGFEWDDFLKQGNMTEEKVEENLKKSAKEYLKTALASEVIAKAEGINLSDKDYEKIMKEYAEKYGYESADEMKEIVGEDAVKEIILQDKVTELLVKECKQVEPKTEK